MDFKEWYIQKYGVKYPGEDWEQWHDAFARIADGFSEYVDEKVKECQKSQS